MRKTIGIIVKLLLIAAVVGAGFFYRERLENLVEFRSFYAPCERPITYSLGTFDPKFGISKNSFLSAMVLAEAIWEKPIDKELFTYVETGGQLTINLIYDSRQETTGQLNDIGQVVEENRAAYEELKAKYEALTAKYKLVKADYENKVATFNRHQDQAGYNRAELKAEFAALKKTEATLNNYVSEINKVVADLNQLAKTLNLNVDAYNTLGAERGEEFTEGEYLLNSSVQEINIYEFSNRDKLVRVLAHELGHALTLDHVADPQAIMYRLNSGQNSALTAEDLTALKVLCHQIDV